MKLSEQIAQTCCGVLADKQEMINKAKGLEAKVMELYAELANSVSKKAYRELLLKVKIDNE